MKKVNVALIGSGFMGKAHSLAYAAVPMFFPDLPLVPVRRVVCDATAELAEVAAQRFGFQDSSANWRQVVEDPVVDLVDISVPNHLHAEIAIAAAQAGKHVICEKPLARTAAEAEPMLAAVQKAGVVHMVAFNYRRTPAVAFARKLITDGAIGAVLNFRGVYLQDWSADPAAPLSWRFQRELAGSGALGDIGAHVLDMARYLVGEVDSVQALLRTYVSERPAPGDLSDALGGAQRRQDLPMAPVDVDDEVLALLKFTNGAVGSLEATRNAYGRHNYLGFEIHGTRGSIVFNYERRDEVEVCFADDPDDRRGFRTVYTGPAHPYGANLWPIPGLGVGYGETKIIECHDLLTAITTGAPVEPSFQDGYQIAKICDALAASASSQQWTAVG